MGMESVNYGLFELSSLSPNCKKTNHLGSVQSKQKYKKTPDQFIKISCVFCQGSIPSMPPYFTCVVRGQIYTLIILIELGM